MTATVRAFLRTWLLQAGWNYDRMQHLGFAFSVLPALKAIYGPGDPLVAAARRHLEYINTHPFLAPTVIGAVVRLEEEVAAGRRRPDEVASFKNGIMGTYGAIGDSFFWAALKPLGAGLALASVLAGAGAWGILVFVAAFDAIATVVRAWGFFRGVREGPMVVARLARVDFPGWTRRLKQASSMVAGIAAALWAHRFAGPAAGVPASAVAWPLLAVLAGAARRGVSPVGLAVALATAAAAWERWGK